MLEDMVKEENETYQEYREVLNNLLQKCQELRRELSMPIVLPFEINVDGINVRHQIKSLKDYLEEYNKLKEDRLNTLERFKEEVRYEFSHLVWFVWIIIFLTVLFFVKRKKKFAENWANLRNIHPSLKFPVQKKSRKYEKHLIP